MVTLSVWKFQTADGAGRAVATLEQLQKEQLIQVHDAAVVEWPEGHEQEQRMREAFADE